MFPGPANSTYLGHLGPVPLFVHWSAILLVLLVAFQCWPAGPVFCLLVLTALMLGIVLHELGHGLTARLLGAYRVTITLHWVGGVCHSNRDQLPRREIAILAAGPLVSFILAGLGWAAWQSAPSWVGPMTQILGLDPTMILVDFCRVLFYLNLSLGIFNSLPIYPLDGGQIFYQLASLVFRSGMKAAQITLMATMVVAFLYIAYCTWTHTLTTWTVVLSLILVHQSWQYLR